MAPPRALPSSAILLFLHALHPRTLVEQKTECLDQPLESSISAFARGCTSPPAVHPLSLLTCPSQSSLPYCTQPPFARGNPPFRPFRYHPGRLLFSAGNPVCADCPRPSPLEHLVCPPATLCVLTIHGQVRFEDPWGCETWAGSAISASALT